MPHIYNIPSSCSLVDILAAKLLKQYSGNLLDLTDVTVFLPNRRAVRELRNAFIRLHGMNATLLPRIMPLGSIDEDGFFFAGNDLNLPPVVSPAERLLIFIRLITARPDNFSLESLSFAQACFLARELATMVDMAGNEQLDFSALENLVPEEYAAHWQNTLSFLKIITEFFPQILAERNLTDISRYNNALLNGQNNAWQKNPPTGEIIIAGTTATFPAMKQLVKTVSELPNGHVYLSGLDKYLDDPSWEQIDETHPQFELKQLLDFLGLSRTDIPDIASSVNPEREKLLSEAMRPASITDKWRNLKQNPLSDQAVAGLNLINCRDSREEALTVAAIMRHNLETPEKTTALITEDRNFARRVSNELLRWNIQADDSAGIPLIQTPQGIFLRLIAKVCASDFAPLPLLSLYKNPFTCIGTGSSAIRAKIRDYEKNILRSRKNRNAEDTDFISEQKKIFSELSELMSQPQAAFKDLLEAHIRLAEALAARPDKSGTDVLWAGEAGETAANLLSSLLEAAETLGSVPQGQYANLFEALLSGTMVRSKYGSHPRLRILGPIEARLCTFDTIIVSGLNEGTMPENASSGAWMSRPMKKDFGFPLPEKAIGVFAHDFCEMACGKEVYLTRAERVQGTPMVKSRWWMRLETILKASGFNPAVLQSSPYLGWSRQFDRTNKITPISPPCPKPPLSARPRELWASDVEKLIYDPYSIFASKILKLRKCDNIIPPLDAVDLGIVVHEILEKFYKIYPHKLPANAEDILSNLSLESFDKNNINDEVRTFWWPRMQKIIKWIIETEKNNRDNIKQTYCETKGTISFQSTGGMFTLGAKADRIDQNNDGSLSIIDYKTGQAHTAKEISAGYAPQLPIEGIIAEQGGFEDIPAATVQKISYWMLGNKTVSVEKEIQKVLDDNFTIIKKLINLFDDENTGYITKPHPKYILNHSDYIHLSRCDEWEINDNDE
uniref:Double-strand break repair protein AddB n=1 Tax=uncultured Alphaproteobacteria bacterium TaxID=91750 RepID=A0A6M4NMV1_9PROT|nr:double-strand break repair protein AddB [uncultured Alphaproteobacteria bacterium]